SSTPLQRPPGTLAMRTTPFAGRSAVAITLPLVSASDSVATCSKPPAAPRVVSEPVLSTPAAQPKAAQVDVARISRPTNTVFLMAQRPPDRERKIPLSISSDDCYPILLFL